MKKPRLPAVSKRKNPSGKIAYRVNYFDPWENRRFQEVVGTRKADAQKLAQHIFEEMMARFHGEQAPEAKEISIQDLIKIFFQTKENRLAEVTPIVKTRFGLI